MSDLRVAVRALARTPGFSITVILALAVGIGATTAIFSLLNGVLLRPLPYPASERLVMVWQDLTARGGPADEWASPGNVRDWQQQSDVFSSLAAVSGWSAALSGDGGTPEALDGEQVSHRYFATLGVEPLLGRPFEASDDLPGAPRVVVLGHDLWRARFNGDRSILGRTIRLAGEPHEVVGVTAPGTKGILVPGAQIWRPRRLDLASASYGSIFLHVVARLADGVTLERGQERLTAVAKSLEARTPQLRQNSIRIQPARDWVVGDARLPLLVLMAAVATLLLLTVMNVANLLLARATSRGREMSVRAALGASRHRLMRLLLFESLVLSLLGGALGVILAAWALDGLLGLVSTVLPRSSEVALDARALAFSALVAAASGVLFGLWPAAQSSRPDLQAPLRDSARTASPREQRVRKALVVAQVALALVVLVSATLLIRSFTGLRTADLGFDPHGLTTVRVALGGAGYRTGSQVLALLRQLEERLPALPGAPSAAFTSVLPLGAAGDTDIGFSIVGRPELLEDGRQRVSWYRSVSGDYFRTMRMRMVGGRSMRPGAREAVVNESFARRFFPGTEATGQQIMIDDERALTVVGVVADTKTRGPRPETRNEMFLPYELMPEDSYWIVLRGGDAAAAALVPSLRALLSSIDPGLPLSQVTTSEALHADSLAQPRLLAVLLGAFAAGALLLALIGIYGVVAYSVGQRTAEIAVRLALGASPRQVVRLVVGDGLMLGLAGIGLGLAAAFAAAGGLGALLYGVAARDTGTYLLASALIAATALVGSWLPARRTSRIAPADSLRG